MSLDLDALENILNIPATGVALAANRDYRMNQTAAVAHPMPADADMQVNDIIKLHDFIGISSAFSVSIGSAGDTFDNFAGPLVCDKGEGTCTIIKIAANTYEVMFENGGEDAVNTQTLAYGRMSLDGNTGAANDLGTMANPTKATFEDANAFGIVADAITGEFTIASSGTYQFNAYHSAEDRNQDMVGLLFVDGEEVQRINSQAPTQNPIVHHFWFERVTLTPNQIIDVRYAGAAGADNVGDQNRVGVVEYFEAQQMTTEAANTQVVRDRSYETNLDVMIDWNASTINQLSINVTSNGTMGKPLNGTSGDITKVFFYNFTADDFTVTLPADFANIVEQYPAVTTMVIPAGKIVVYSMLNSGTNLFWAKLSN